MQRIPLLNNLAFEYKKDKSSYSKFISDNFVNKE